MFDIKERIIVLIQTRFPRSVVPAINRCGEPNHRIGSPDILYQEQ